MIAALYDIHGNLPALESVLAEVRAERFDLIVVGGDVTPGPQAGACLEAIRSAGVPWVGLRGNGENDVLAARSGRPVPSRVPDGVHPLIRWCAGALSDRDADELAGWAPSRTVEVAPLGRVLFCHATPRDDNEIFTEVTPGTRVAPAFQDVDAAVVVCGHTHMPFDRTVDGVRIVNAGSVGMPFGDVAAQWLAVHDDRLEMRRSEYDLARAQARIDETGYPGPFDVANPPGRDAMTAALEAAAI